MSESWEIARKHFLLATARHPPSQQWQSCLEVVGAWSTGQNDGMCNKPFVCNFRVLLLLLVVVVVVVLFLLQLDNCNHLRRVNNSIVASCLVGHPVRFPPSFTKRVMWMCPERGGTSQLKLGCTVLQGRWFNCHFAGQILLASESRQSVQMSKVLALSWSL